MQTSKDPHDAPLSDVACVESLFSNSALSFILKVLRPDENSAEPRSIDYSCCASRLFSVEKLKKKKIFTHIHIRMSQLLAKAIFEQDKLSIDARTL